MTLDISILIPHNSAHLVVLATAIIGESYDEPSQSSRAMRYTLAFPLPPCSCD